MTRTQRLILGTGLLLLALITHLYFCDWSLGGEASGPALIGWAGTNTEHRTIPVVQSDGTPGTITVPRPVPNHWGVFAARPPANSKDSFIWGIIAPAIMLLVSITLMTGWRQCARRERGQCLRCGYDLKFKYEAGCPECGWRRSA